MKYFVVFCRTESGITSLALDLERLAKHITIYKVGKKPQLKITLNKARLLTTFNNCTVANVSAIPSQLRQSSLECFLGAICCY